MFWLGLFQRVSIIESNKFLPDIVVPKIKFIEKYTSNKINNYKGKHGSIV